MARLIQSSRLLGRRGERQLRTGHPADRSGRTVPGRADPQRRRHQVAGRGPGPVHRRGRQRRSAGAVGAADRARRRPTRPTPRSSGIRPTFPMLAANLANFGRIGVIYRKSLEQALVIFPALMAALITVGGGVPGRRGRQAGLQGRPAGPAAVLDGLHPADADPVAGRHHAARPADRPVLQDGAERSGRGARRAQLSVPGVPRQAGTDDSALPRPAGLRADRQQPVARSAGAVRHTGRGSADDILPPNKFPFIPPQVDPDPGPPVVQLPPGVAPGPGPAPHAPFPLPVPPNDNGPPPPWPYYAPPDQVVPPYGRPAPDAPPAPPAPPPTAQPLPAEAPAAWAHHPPEGQGDGPAMATYDQNGKFVDPAGGTGVFAAGADKLAPAENWVDLMLAPRQA